MNRVMMRTIASVLAMLAVGCSAVFGGGANVVIVKPGASKSSMSLSGLTAAGSNAALFHKTLGNDLARSGYFTISPTANGTYQVSGSCTDAGGNLSVRCQVRDGSKSYLDKTYSEEGRKARRLAHKVADEILLAVKQVKGIASTRIVMVGNVGGRKDLYICDADGGSLVQLTRDGAPCISPRWSPDGNSIVYTSYRSGFPDVYVMDLNTYEWRRIANYPGLNTGGAFSPYGRNVAVILSKDGNPELYTMRANGGRPNRLTATPRIAEASPSWSPAGNEIVYVSNAARLPQLYITDLLGNQRRLGLLGSENVAPDWGPAGIVRCSRREGRYGIYVYDMAKGRDTNVMAPKDDNLDSEDPSWAPDGRHIACTRTGGHHSDVYILDYVTDGQGDAPVRLTTAKGEWYSPSWSPK